MGDGGVLAVPLLDVPEEALGELGHGGVLASGHLGLLLLSGGGFADGHQLSGFVAFEAGVLEGQVGVPRDSFSYLPLRR